MKEGYTMNLNNKHYKILKYISKHRHTSYASLETNCKIKNLEYYLRQLHQEKYLYCSKFGLCFSSISLKPSRHRSATPTIKDEIYILPRGEDVLEEYTPITDRIKNIGEILMLLMNVYLLVKEIFLNIISLLE